jgi:hypothetical protein
MSGFLCRWLITPSIRGIAVCMIDYGHGAVGEALRKGPLPCTHPESCSHGFFQTAEALREA